MSDIINRKGYLSSSKSQYMLLDEEGQIVESCNSLFDVSNKSYLQIIALNPILQSLIDQLLSEACFEKQTLQCVNFVLPNEQVRFVDISIFREKNQLEILIEDFTSAYQRVSEYQKDRNDYANNSTIQKARSEVLERSKEFMIHTFEDLSHELRNPLTSLVGLSNLISSEGQEENVQALRSTSKLLIQIADNLLDISTLENKVELQQNEVIIADIVDDLKNTFSFQAKAKNITFEIMIGAGIPKAIKTDKSRLTQVLYNLLGNALKFTHKGKIKLLLTGDEQSIYFQVQDTGIGIEAQKLESILNRFSQAHDDIQNIYGGLGLGLSISKQIVSMMHGEFHVKSVMHEGSEFSFKIPVTKTQTVNQTIDKTHLAGLKILLVDDDVMNLIVIKKQLEKMDLTVTTTNTGKDVIEMLNEHKYDLLIVDYQMPEMNGKQVIDAVKKHFKIPIILLSGYSEKSEMLKDVSPDKILTKPATTEKIIEAIDQLYTTSPS